LPAVPEPRHGCGTFVVTEDDDALVRAAFDRGGELVAAVEPRWLFPGITDTVQARTCTRTIAAWQKLPATPHPLVPGRRKQG
jgi:hypothetical protein